MLSEANLARIQSAGDPVTTSTRVRLWADSIRGYGTPTASAKPPKHDTAATRQPFTEVVSNAQRPKRKAVEPSIRTNPSRECKRKKKVMGPTPKDGDANKERRPRGRPRKILPPDTVPRGGMAQSSVPPPLPPPPPANRTAIPAFEIPTPDARSRSTSPKKNRKTDPQVKPDAGIGTRYLRFCKPTVIFQTYENVRATGDPLPPAVIALLNALDKIRAGFIPREMQDMYDKESDTPRKTRVPPHQDDYARGTTWDLPSGCSAYLKGLIDDIVEMASLAYEMKAPERQWADTTVTPLVAEVRRWPKNRQLAPFNVEYCQIQPNSIRMTRPTGNIPFGSAPPAPSVSTTASLSQDGDLTVARMVDKSIGLRLDKEDKKIIDHAFHHMADKDHSVNQTLTYIQAIPLVFDIELKKTLSDRDPEVQLAIWKAAYYSKLLYHGWDTSLPMPCIVVNGHNWDYYIAYVQDETLIMMGPRRFGSTVDVNGTFEIVYKLNVLMNWGENVYRPWFKTKVISSLKAHTERAESRSM